MATPEYHTFGQDFRLSAEVTDTNSVQSSNVLHFSFYRQTVNRISGLEIVSLAKVTYKYCPAYKLEIVLSKQGVALERNPSLSPLLLHPGCQWLLVLVEPTAEPSDESAGEAHQLPRQPPRRQVQEAAGKTSFASCTKTCLLQKLIFEAPTNITSII